MEDDEWQRKLWQTQERGQALPLTERVLLKPRPGRPAGEPPRAVSLLEIPRQWRSKSQGRREQQQQQQHQRRVEGKREEEMEEEVEEECQEEEEEEEEIVTVFLVHGAMASWRQFTRLLPSLSRHFRVVCFDAYGCGESPKPADIDGSAFATEELFEDLKEVYERFKGKGGNVLVGHSFGSSQVMRLAEYVQRGGEGGREGGWTGEQQQQQQQCHGHHTQGAGARAYPHFSSSSSSSSSSLLGLILLASAYHVPDGGNPIFTLPLPVLNLIKPILSQAFRRKAIDSHADTSIWKEQARGNQGNPMYVVKPFYQHLRWASRESIHSLSCPCVVVHGETDGIIPLYQGRALAANLTRAEFYMFRQTGHQIMQERPAETCALIIAAAKNWARARAGGRAGGRERREASGNTVLMQKKEEREQSPLCIAAEEEEEEEEGMEGEEGDNFACVR